RRPGDDGDAHLRPPDRMAELGFPAAECRRRGRLAEALWQWAETEFRSATRLTGEWKMPDGNAVDYDGLIPNNVGLADDLRVRKALETWHPGYIDWCKTVGPEGCQNSPVYL